MELRLLRRRFLFDSLAGELQRYMAAIFEVQLTDELRASQSHCAV